jgi:hypothetical protein
MGNKTTMRRPSDFESMGILASISSVGCVKKHPIRDLCLPLSLVIWHPGHLAESDVEKHSNNLTGKNSNHVTA